jgi:excisionase family DNA binding protein
MNPTPDLTHWRTKTAAAIAIGVSSKTVEKLAAEGKLQTARRPLAGSPPQIVYHPDDVQREAEAQRAKMQPGAFKMPQLSELPEALPEVASKPLGQLSHLLAEALREAFQKPPERLFLTVREASHLTGLTQRYLREQIAAGSLEGIRDGRRLRIRRKDLEGL